MPVHDWSRVDAGLFHHFHHSWIEELQRALNAKVLPSEFYAMAEQFAGGFGPDVLTLQDTDESARGAGGASVGRDPGERNLALMEPRLEVWGETEMEYYRRKQTSVAVRHVSGDRVVAMIEVVSPGNKNSRNGIEMFVRKAAELLSRGIHLLILDLLPPGPRDPGGIHGVIWEFLEGVCPPAAGRPITMASYEVDVSVRAYVVTAAVGDRLGEMPLFLAPGGCVEVPMEETYQSAFNAFPRRWRHLLEPATP